MPPLPQDRGERRRQHLLWLVASAVMSSLLSRRGMMAGAPAAAGTRGVATPAPAVAGGIGGSVFPLSRRGR